jgi:hypothetical protein
VLHTRQQIKADDSVLYTMRGVGGGNDSVLYTRQRISAEMTRFCIECGEMTRCCIQGSGARLEVLAEVVRALAEGVGHGLDLLLQLAVTALVRRALTTRTRTTLVTKQSPSVGRYY